MADGFPGLAAARLPGAFGKQAKPSSPDGAAVHLKAKRPADREHPEAPAGGGAAGQTLPLSHEARIQAHAKTVAALDVDRSGSRLVSGGYDYNLGYYDFAGMDASLQPFRWIEPDGAYKVKALRFSLDSQWLLVAMSSNTPVLMDRDGSKVRTYTDGDPYLRDMKHTKGHVAALTACCWSPTNADNFLTAGEDGTVRIWNMGYRQQQDYVLVVKGRKASAARSAVTHARYSNDGSTILTGSADGSLKLYPAKGPWTFPASEILGAHQPGSEITCLAIDQSTGHMVSSRATDGTLKLWDMRSWRAPVATAGGLDNFCSETACVFSPDDSLVVTGTSAKRGDEWGRLVFLSARDLAPVHTVGDLTRSSVVGLLWPGSLNQIITGNGDGSSCILYDPTVSHRGALLPMARAPAARQPAVVVDGSAGRAIAPHALPLFKDESGKSLKRIKIKERKDPVKSHRPELPLGGPGQGGRIGGGVIQAIMTEHLPQVSTRHEDPREALLKYAQQAEENPMFVTPAYSQTQPRAVMDASLLEKEVAAEKKRQADKEALARLQQ